jgi:AhpD family alkylhydroperoxidase
MKEQRYFSIRTFNRTFFDAMYMIAKYRKYLKKIDKKFKSSIMLVVTNVNGCRLCSHHHTSELLKSGVSNAELKSLLEGNYDEVDPYQVKALLFAEHYADVTGDYDSNAFDTIKQYYGNEIAIGILASIKLIMFGNMNGISLGNILNRVRFKKISNSKFYTDIYNGIIAYLLVPIMIFINLFRSRIEY